MNTVFLTATIALIALFAGTGTALAAPCHDSTQRLNSELEVNLKVDNQQATRDAEVKISWRPSSSAAGSDSTIVQDWTTVKPRTSVTVILDQVNDWIVATDIKAGGRTYTCEFTVRRFQTGGDSSRKTKTAWQDFSCNAADGAPASVVCAKTFSNSRWETSLTVLDTLTPTN